VARLLFAIHTPGVEGWGKFVAFNSFNLKLYQLSRPSQFPDFMTEPGYHKILLSYNKKKKNCCKENVKA